jgi:hypothetical protein
LPSAPSIFLHWSGFDEGDEISGDGSAELQDDGSIEIELSFDNGDNTVRTGFGSFIGPSIRYRIYTPMGLTAGEVAEPSAFAARSWKWREPPVAAPCVAVQEHSAE